MENLLGVLCAPVKAAHLLSTGVLKFKTSVKRLRFRKTAAGAAHNRKSVPNVIRLRTSTKEDARFNDLRQ